MKEVWKRITCLSLCGVLLLGNVPMGVFAEDQTTQQEQTLNGPAQLKPEQNLTGPAQLKTEQETKGPAQIQKDSSDPSAMELTEQKDAKETEAAPTGITVNGKDLSEQPVAGIAYDANNTILKLNGLTLAAETGIVLPETVKTIELTGANTIQAKGAAIYAASDLTITGDGYLRAASEAAAVIVVRGSGTGDKLRGLTIGGSVQMEVTSTFQPTQMHQEPAVAMDSINGVVIGDAAHLRTSHTKSGQPYSFETGAYEKTEQEFAERTQKISANGGALELIGAGHYDNAWRSDGENHYRSTCHKIGDKDCSFAVKTQEGRHDSTGENVATCQDTAVCDTCGLSYGQKDPDNHAVDTTVYVLTSGDAKHLLVHSCCEAACEGAEEEDHDLIYQVKTNQTEKTASIVEACSKCSYETAKVTLADPAASYDGLAKPVTVTDNTGENLSITYSTGEDALPVNAGTYTAQVTWQEQTASLTYTIARKPLTQAMVQGIPGTNPTYTGEAIAKPEITVTDTAIADQSKQTLVKDTDYTVAYYRGEAPAEEPIVNAGVISIRIIPTAQSNYTAEGGALVIPWTIDKAQISLDFFETTVPGSAVYSGSAREATAVLKDESQSIGEFRVQHYPASVKSQEPVTPVNAGSYTAKLVADGNENFEAVTFELGTFAISAAPASAYEMENNDQKILQGTDAFREPFGKTVNGGETVSGTSAYKLNGSDIYITELKTRIRDLKQSDPPLKIDYVFTPQNGNYEGTKEGSFTITAVAVRFAVNDVPVDDEHPAFTVKENPVVGDEGIVTLKEGLAAIAGTGDSAQKVSTGFRVMFRKGTAAETATPSFGSYSFTVYFTGEIGGVSCENVVVDTGTVEIAKKTPTATPPEALVLPYNAEAQELIEAAEITAPTADGEAKVLYKVNGGAWSENLPKGTQTGVYEIFYKIDCTDTSEYDDKEFTDKLTAVIHPTLTATYGDKLSEVTIQPSDGKWTWKENAETLAGPVGNAGEVTGFKMDYKAVADGEITWSGNVTIRVNPLTVTPTVTAVSDGGYLPYEDEAKPAVTVTYKDAADQTKTLDPAKDYTVAYEYPEDTKTGEMTIKVAAKENGNYVFDGPAEDTVILYKFSSKTLDGNIITKLEDEDKENGLEHTDFNTLDKVKAELSKDLKEAEYPATNRAYYESTMIKWGKAKNAAGNVVEGWVYNRAEEAFPTNGYDFIISYEKLGIDNPENVDFKVYYMDAQTSERLGTTAGEVTEVDAEDIDLGEKNISFHVDGHAAVCIAWTDDPEAVFDVKATSSSYGTVKFTVKHGTKTSEAKTSATAQKGDTITVTVSPKSGYSVSKVVYKYKEGTTTKSATPKQSGGKYIFTMPSADVTITATFKKTTSSTKNPNSGDSSNIYFWSALMGVSGIAMVALLAQQRKRRAR